MEEIAIFWFRRDLRLVDNTGLWHALASGYRVLPLFIYDENILSRLDRDDSRMSFLGDILTALNSSLVKYESSLFTISSSPVNAFRELSERFIIKGVYFNRDYEPYAIERDTSVTDFLKTLGVPCFSFKDQVIFEKDEVMKSDGKPYTVFTPYSKKWLTLSDSSLLRYYPSETLLKNFAIISDNTFFTPDKIRFKCPAVKVKSPVLDPSHISEYDHTRDIPSLDGCSYLGPYLRFGAISIRDVFRRTEKVNSVFTNELIWREFFMQILYHFPHLTEKSFRPEYDKIEWINNEDHFARWSEGKTGYPLVDAGMHELNATGYMHNRVRMVTAGFLTKHLLTDWRWGEAYFASKLLDYELSSNNDNWQWAAGCGCDAAPYFRVFNPQLQMEKFDPELKYVRKWVPEYNTRDYQAQIVDHKLARERAIEYFRSAINKY